MQAEITTSDCAKDRWNRKWF